MALGYETIREIERQEIVRAREIWATNATAFFSRCTPASVEGVEMLEAIFAGHYEGKEAA